MQSKDPIHRFAVPASLVLSAGYTVSFVVGPYPGSWLVKSAAVGLLALASRRSALLALALGFGAVGDALLDLGPGLFICGLVAFLLGHITYATCFFRHPAARRAVVAQLLVASCAVTFLLWLWPWLGGMRSAVLCYFAAITIMTLASLRIGGGVAVGALLFLMSDALLAIDRFKVHLPFRDWLIWGSYYFGQLSIAVAFSSGERAMRKPVGGD